MSKERASHRCRECGAESPRWAGRCCRCGQWNTLEEVRSAAPAGAAAAVMELGGLDCPPAGVLATGLGELDRVLGGGLVESSVTLITGEPGIGKSTLLLQALRSLAERGEKVLLVSAEESPAQVQLRARRLGGAPAGLYLTACTDVAAIGRAVGDLRPAVVVVDSVQTVGHPGSGAAPGTVAAVKAAAADLTESAKAGGPATVLVGHVTKDGSIAGPRVLEHLVDTVLSFEGDRHHALRLLRAVKHRFGSVGEVGMWEMTPRGLEETPEAAGLLLADRRVGVAGSVLFPALAGRRPVVVEIQALVASAAGGPPRRSSAGYEPSRLGQLLAVLDRRAGLSLRESDVYVSVVGGMRLGDPGADLAVGLAVASAATGRLVDPGLVAVGEVGLGGEVRQVAATPRRLVEAARLGFTRAVAAPGAGAPPGVTVAEAPTLAAALDVQLGAAAPYPRIRLVKGAVS